MMDAKPSGQLHARSMSITHTDHDDDPVPLKHLVVSALHSDARIVRHSKLGAASSCVRQRGTACPRVTPGSGVGCSADPHWLTAPEQYNHLDQHLSGRKLGPTTRPEPRDVGPPARSTDPALAPCGTEDITFRCAVPT